MDTRPDISQASQDSAPAESCQCPPATSGGSKSKRNFFVDVATAVVFAAMVGTGILLKWILPPGRFGGRGLSWLGLDRHGWGDVHLWLAIALLALVVAHVVLHFNWVRACWQRCVGSGRSVRTWALLALLAALMLLPLLVPVSRDAPGRGFGRGWGRGVHAAAERLEAAGPPSESGGGWRRGAGRGLRRAGAAPAAGSEVQDEPLWGSGAELWEGDYGP